VVIYSISASAYVGRNVPSEGELLPLGFLPIVRPDIWDVIGNTAIFPPFLTTIDCENSLWGMWIDEFLPLLIFLKRYVPSEFLAY
jgi:hypothetical protein